MEPVHHPIKVKEKASHLEKQDAEPMDTSKYDIKNLESLRKIIGVSSAKNNELDKNDTKRWHPILIKLLHVLCTNEEIGNESVLLASHAYLALQKALYSTREFEDNLMNYLNLQKNLVIIEFDKNHIVYNIDLFKLIICNGFLQLGDKFHCSHDIYEKIFHIIYPHCIRYTRFTYFAFKILQLWMQRTSKIDLWSKNSLKLEEKLESIIFSNWDNAICKANVVGLFGVYLDVMKKKYNDFIPYLFYSCVERISWCHVTKYTILSEICDALDNVDLMIESKFISNLFNSLTINYLCSASTKVYTNICNKLSKDLWKTTFGEHLKNYVITWEAEKKYSTLQVLCKCWIEPLIKTHRDILPFLLECCDEESILYQSHLLRIAKKYGIAFTLPYKDPASLLDHEEEIARLNIYAAYCYEGGNITHSQSSIAGIKNFLYFNATTDSTYLREGIFNYFKILFSNIIKSASIQGNSEHAISFLDWLHSFQTDCFEIGSCYQRKIFGLHLYKITLQFLYNNNCNDTFLSKDPHFKDAMKYGPLLQEELKQNGKWKFTDKKTIILLFKFVLDPATDIKEYSASIITDFFNSDILTDSEKASLFITALENCNSCKFYETDSGAYLFKILSKWFPLNEINKSILKQENNFRTLCSIDEFQSYAQFLFKEGIQQFHFVKSDILKAITQKTPFYGVITALSLVGFSNGPECSFITKEFLEEVMNMTENAINYFLNAFSSKSSNLEYSSSFEEMGLAIDEAIKSSEINYEFDEQFLSPAQQSVITCIWRSLKILCELVVELSKSKYATDSIICRAGELIVTVLLKCRHKGVIESAGVSIGNLSRYLCKIERNVGLLESFLKKLLDNDFSTSINLTRRGAGLTIMFHRIIVNDVRTERPLLHFAINSLIQSLRESSAMKVEQREVSNYDDPCAMHLHFLKTLVADKSLQPQLSPYLEHICLTCFEYMSSPIFTIRNASHQLFGAIVSRLVGQNTGAKSVDFGYGYSINYFATHFPQLAATVLLSLQACCQPLENENSKWRNSTNIIHVLSLLSKMFFSGCELIDGTSISYVKQIRSCLNLFLSSPMAHVRNLASKSYTATVGLSSIEQEICQLKTQIATTNNFNHLNGYLCTLEYLYEKQDDELKSTTIKHKKMKSLSEVRRNLEIRSKIEILWNFWIRRSILIKRKKLCYAVEAQLLRLSRKFKVIIDENYQVESKKKHNFDTLFEKTQPGFFEYVDELMNLFVSYISYNEDYTLIKTMLGSKCIDFGTSFLKHAQRHNRNLLMTSIDFANQNFEKSHKILLEEINNYTNESIRNIFKGKLIELQYVDISKLKTFASKLEGAFVRTIQLSELLTFIHVLSLRGSGTFDLFEDLISCISKEKITLNNYFTYPEILRQLIAKGLEILLYNFNHLNPKCRVTPLLASLILMKDEVHFIREMIRDSVLDNIIIPSKLSKERVTDEFIYSSLLLNLASDSTLLGELSDNQVLEFFEKYLSTVKQTFTTFDIENPFDDNDVTFYKEESKLINFIVFCIQQKISKSIFTKDKGMYENISSSIFNVKDNILKEMNIDLDNLQDILNTKYNEYLTLKLKVVSEVYLKKVKANDVNYN